MKKKYPAPNRIPVSIGIGAVDIEEKKIVNFECMRDGEH